MKTLIKHLFILSIIGTAQASERDFEAALKLHARSYAYDLLSAGIKAEPDKGVNYLFEHHLPTSIDDRCGYMERAGLNEAGFDRKRALVSSVAGKRLMDAYGAAIKRRGARLDLAGVDVHKIQGREHALVRLVITPAQKGDESLGLLYRYDTRGDLSLCDVTIGRQLDKGVLSTLGKELAEPVR